MCNRYTLQLLAPVFLIYNNIQQTILDTNEFIVHDDAHENFVFENELAASTVNLKVYFWVNTKDYRKSAIVVRGNLIRKIKETLEQEGFYLPADITELKLYGNEEDIPLRVKKDPGETKVS